MEIRPNVIVPLGYGKYVRADKIVALEPIEDDRGPGRRTMVYIEQLSHPVVASRTEHTIIESMVQTPAEVLEAAAALELLRDLHDDIGPVGPMLRTSIKKEVGLDLNQIERKIKEILDRQYNPE